MSSMGPPSVAWLMNEVQTLWCIASKKREGGVVDLQHDLQVPVFKLVRSEWKDDPGYWHCNSPTKCPSIQVMKYERICTLDGRQDLISPYKISRPLGQVVSQFELENWNPFLGKVPNFWVMMVWTPVSRTKLELHTTQRIGNENLGSGDGWAVSLRDPTNGESQNYWYLSITSTVGTNDVHENSGLIHPPYMSLLLAEFAVIY